MAGAAGDAGSEGNACPAAGGPELREGAFALGTFDAGAGAFPGVARADGAVLDASALYPSTRAMLADWGAAYGRLADLADSTSADHRVDEVRPLAPIEPPQVVQSGANYYKHVLDLIVAEHRAEGVSEDEARADGRAIMDERVASGEPYLFLGAVGAVCGPYDDVLLPAHGERHDWELELAAVVGPDAEVAGYTIVNDLTTRDLVYRPDLKALGTDWLRSKNAPTFLPTGPYIVPAAFVADPMDLRVTLRLNDEVMQDESTSDMIFDVGRLLAYARERVRLLPGDLLLTGSPAGNGAHWGRFLRDGDVMDGDITGLGRQRNRCVTARHSP